MQIPHNLMGWHKVILVREHEPYSQMQIRLAEARRAAFKHSSCYLRKQERTWGSWKLRTVPWTRLGSHPWSKWEPLARLEKDLHQVNSLLTAWFSILCTTKWLKMSGLRSLIFPAATVPPGILAEGNRDKHRTGGALGDSWLMANVRKTQKQVKWQDVGKFIGRAVQG